MNEANGRLFVRVCRGVYVAKHGEAVAIALHGDVWERIKEIESEVIDMIITNPGYTWLNHHLERGTTRKQSGSWSYPTRDIDKDLLREMFRVLKSQKESRGTNGQPVWGGAHCFIFCPSLTGETKPHIDALITEAETVGFQFNKLFVWDKKQMGMGYNGRPRYESILFMSKGKRAMPFDKSVKDVLEHQMIFPTKRRHESEKPVDLYRELVRFGTMPGDIVMDLFAGSLNVARAALAEGRHAVVIEIVQKFIEAVELYKPKVVVSNQLMLEVA
ncbi:MAG: site-specific DNA-methyltransferase [bacterium]